jgi:hypothetical protein
MTLAENLGERGDRPPPPPPVPPQDRLTPQIPDGLKRGYQKETETAERAVTSDVSSPSLMQKIYLTLAALIVVLTSYANDETPSPEPNQARQEHAAPAKYHVSHGDLAVDETLSPEPNQARQEYAAPANDKVSPQEYVSPANDKVPAKDLPDLAVGILKETGKIVSAIGGDAKDKADALDDAARLAADRNENAPEIEFRREDLDRSQDEDK